MLSQKELLRLKHTSINLIIWMRELQHALRDKDKIEEKKARESIEYDLDVFDELKLTFRTQNELLQAGRNSTSKYINDYIRSITFYFNDEDLTILQGSEVLAIY